MRRRSARLSSTGLPPSDSRDSVEHFNTRFSLLSFLKKVRRLTDEQRNAIERTGFGALLLIPNQTVNKNLLLELMRRWDFERHSLVLPCGNVGLTPRDVALTMGLRVVGDPVLLDDHEPFIDLESRYGATLWKRNVKVASVESRLDGLGEICNDDFVRTFLLYTFGNFLFPNADGKVDTRYLSFLRNVDGICGYAWGLALLGHLIKWLDKRKEVDAVYVGGCLLFLQIWSFEHIDVARPALLDSCAAFPRMCHWDKAKSLNKEQLVSNFKNLQGHQVTWELQPSLLELEIDVVKELLEAQSQGKEISEAGDTNANFPIVHGINLGTRHQFRNQEVIEVETPSCEGKSERDVILDSPAQNIPHATDVIDCCSTPRPLAEFHEQLNHADTSKESSTIILLDDEVEASSRVRMLEEQNMKLRKEIEQLQSSYSQLEEKNTKLMSENSDLRTKNRSLRLSSDYLADRIEKILLVDDTAVNEESHPVEELGAETS